MKWLRAWICTSVFALALGLGCGGGEASSDEGADESSTSAAPSAGGEDPTDSGRRRATDGAVCDYGGSAERTCLRGLYCCYGPPDNPGEHGSCMAECPEY